MAVCNLASVVLPKFVRADEKGQPVFDHHARRHGRDVAGSIVLINIHGAIVPLRRRS